VIENLTGNGRERTEPIAIVRDAGRPSQRIWRGTLGDILAGTARESLSPAIIVIGPVVERAIVSSPLPLSGKTVLVTRAAERAVEFTTLLSARGARVIELPALTIGPPSSWEGVDRALEVLSSFDWLLLTSANAVNYFFDRLTELQKDARDLAGVRLAVVGKKTAQVLRDRGLRADFMPTDFQGDSLARELPGAIEGKRFLFPRVETGGREVLVRELSGRGGGGGLESDRERT
jgi:uroporphyrinogen III methyltransferase/synthase